MTFYFTYTQTQRVDINYHLPTAYKNVYLRFTSSDDILLETNDNIRIDALNGVYALDFVVKASGDSHILIWIDAVKGFFLIRRYSELMLGLISIFSQTSQSLIKIT
jgi:hypothetical protein